MRLLLVTQDFPPDTGGTQTYAFELARRLAPRCEAFAVVAPRVEGWQEVDAALPLRVIRVRAGYDSLSVKALPALLRHTRVPFDASLHVQWPTALAGLAARRLRRLRRVYVAAHGRELLFNPLPAPLAGAYHRLRRLALTRADHLFPVSRYTSDLLADAGIPPERRTVVHNGTDPDRFAPQDPMPLRARLALGDRPTLLTISRLVPRKGLDTVLQALPRVAEAVPQVVYLIGGTGPDRPRLERLAHELGVASHVRFCGRIPDDDLPTYYSAADVFVMPSRLDPPHVEGFGIVFLEANACGTPVVGAHTGGIPDAIVDGETGLLVPPDDPAALARALTGLLLNPPLARRMGLNGRRRVVTAFTWDHAADRLYEAIRQDLRGFAKLPL
ncbi:MAG: glycosyltransferase family 1 protein [Bacteroidetes bacterium]|nr:MAG: glycosyltransferase family 1 protein [Bacteroidota bacterium]